MYKQGFIRTLYNMEGTSSSKNIAKISGQSLFQSSWGWAGDISGYRFSHTATQFHHSHRCISVNGFCLHLVCVIVWTVIRGSCWLGLEENISLLSYLLDTVSCLLDSPAAGSEGRMLLELLYAHSIILIFFALALHSRVGLNSCVRHCCVSLLVLGPDTLSTLIQQYLLPI